MSHGKFNVLIIDDDQKFGQALLKAFAKHNIEAQHVSNPEAALTICMHEDFNVLVVDCMLPRMDGMALVQALKAQNSFESHVVMITGVFKDKGFLKEAQTATGAELVLLKPFPLEDLLSYVREVQEGSTQFSSTLNGSALEWICNPQATKEEILDFFNGLERLDGRQLPFLISLSHRFKVTGGFKIALPQGQKGEIYLRDGDIEQVHLEDSKSLLGHILMDLGYVEPEDLEEALKSSQSAPLGQKLIHQMSVSPHSVDLALLEQTILRLSQFVVSDVIELSFSADMKSSLKEPKPLSPKRLFQLFKDWSESKFEESFLKVQLDELMDSPFTYTSKLSVKAPVDEPLSSLAENISLNELMYCILSGDIQVEYRPHTPRTEDKEVSRLSHLIDNLKSMNDFQVLGLTQKASSPDVKKAFLLLSDSLRKQSGGKEVSGKVQELQLIVAKRLRKAYDNLKDDTNRTQYLKEMEAKTQLELIQREPEFILALDLIATRKYPDALEILRRLSREKMNYRDLQSYLLIAEAKASGQVLRDSDLMRIPPEARHSPGYLIAKGVCLKGTKNYAMAMQSFKKALVYEPNSRLAKSELRSCLKRMESKKSDAGFFLSDLFGSKGKKGA